MEFEKRSLTEMNRCYATSSIVVDGQTRLLLATEGQGPCLAWCGDDYRESHAAWDGPGGTMAIVPIPGTNGEFLAVQNFLKMVECDDAKIVHVVPQPGGGYTVSDALHLPYIHRFDLLPVGERTYFIGCTLSTHKASREDWSNPGQVWVGEFSGSGPIEVRLLKSGLTKNHGFSRLVKDGRSCALVTCEEGAYEITPRQTADGEWSVKKFMDWPISDIAAIDIDGDGELEYATIEPFHGTYFRVYKKIAGVFTKIYEHPEVSEFYHVVVADYLAGAPVFIGGCRRGRQQLFTVRSSASDPKTLVTELIEEGVGPSNVHVVHEKGRDIVVSANREKAEAALYFVRAGAI
jgi:hypothetical protein